ncbi:MAG: S8 family serine peptidase [Halanaerobiales bacterium]|nr:S8 family serine peptidase [Halanaerobiales bacterium]
MRKKLIVISLIGFVFLLTGCFPDLIIIDGKVIDDRDGESIQGIKVTCNGSVTETNSIGNFHISLPDVEYPTDVTVYIDGTELGFEKKEMTVRVYPKEGRSMGSVELKREKALIYGTVTTYLTSTANLKPLSTTSVELPTIEGPAYAEGEIIVKFKDSYQPQSIQLLSTEMNIEILAQDSKAQIVTLKTKGDTDEAIKKLKDRPDVEYAEPNYYVYPLSVTEPANLRTQAYCNDTYYNYQWNLQAINIENAWSVTMGNSNVRVAVLDTGIRSGLTDLNANIDWASGYDFVDNDSDPSVFWDSHGTRVASIIGALPNNSYGIAGINESVSIVPIRILRSTINDGYYGKTDELLRGLEYAIYDADVDVINLSVAIQASYSEAIDDMIKFAEEEGVLIIGAAGNNGDSYPTYPASHSKVLSVGAVGPTLQPASYTNRGVDIYAPGGDYDVYPIGNQNMIMTDYWSQGTSLASAHVAGVAALMLAKEPYLSPSELRSRLRNTSLQLAYGEGDTGLVDAYRAVTNLEHGRLFVFLGTESYNGFTYDPKESTYTYNKDDENYFKLATVEPGYRHLIAWIDSNADDKLSYGDFFAEKYLNIESGEMEQVYLNLYQY